MNDYMEGSLEACKVLSKNKAEFIKNVKLVTGLTDKGIKGSKFIQDIITELKK